MPADPVEIGVRSQPQQRPRAPLAGQRRNTGPVIRLPGLPEGVQAVRICHGNQVGEEEFELRGKTVKKGGHFGVSAVVVIPRDGWEFIREENAGPDHYVVKRKGA